MTKSNKPNSQTNNNTEQKTTPLPNVIVITPKEDNSEMRKIAKNANIIYLAGVIANAALVIITLFALYYTKSSVREQSEAFKEARREFLVQNVPYLQCQGFKFFQFEPNKPPAFAYNIANAGNTPAQIIDAKVGFLYTQKVPINPMKQIINFKPDSNIIGLYVIKESNQTFTFLAKDTLKKLSYNEIRNGHLHAYFFGEITYRNVMTNQKMKYTFNTVFLSVPDTVHSVNFVMPTNSNDSLSSD